MMGNHESEQARDLVGNIFQSLHANAQDTKSRRARATQAGLLYFTGTLQRLLAVIEMDLFLSTGLLERGRLDL